MIKTYLIIAICGLIFAAYTLGASHSTAKCNQRAAQQTINTITTQQIKTEKINAEIYHTGMRDIRRILHEKYTIAE